MPHGKHYATIAALIAFALLATSARATITGSLVLSPSQPSVGAIADAATFDQVNLANYKTYDLDITLSGSGTHDFQDGNGPVTVGDDWQSAGMQFHLNTGTFYIADKVTQPHGPSNTSRWSSPGFQEYQYDTFLSNPPNHGTGNGAADFPNTSITTLGRFNPDDGTAPVWISNEINVDWVKDVFNSYRNPVGSSVTFTLARLTISNNATGYLYGKLFSEFGPTDGVNITVSAGGFAPEPASLGLLLIGTGAFLRRPRRRASRG